MGGAAALNNLMSLPSLIPCHEEGEDDCPLRLRLLKESGETKGESLEEGKEKGRQRGQDGKREGTEKGRIIKHEMCVLKKETDPEKEQPF